jgi:hypothetical protein
MKRRVVPVAEFRTAVGVVQVDHDVAGIEQYNQVLREVRWRELDSNFRFRARFGSGFVVSLFALRVVAEG